MGAPPTTLPAPPAAPPGEMAGFTEALERQLVGARAVEFVTRHVQPPAALYVTADDGLYCLVSNVQAGLVLNLTATTLLPDGRVQANSWQMAPPSNGTQTPYLFPLTESFLLNVSVMPAGSVRYGQVWIFCTIRRGGLASGVNLQTVLSDYLDAYGGPTWPGSRIRHATEERGLVIQTLYGALPSGQAVTLTMPVWARALVRSVFCQLNTSATVASRQVYLDLLDAAGNRMYRDMTEPTVAASSTGAYSWGLKLGTAQSAPALNYLVRSLPEVFLMPGGQLLVSAANLQATDGFVNVQVDYEQWFHF